MRYAIIEDEGAGYTGLQEAKTPEEALEAFLEETYGSVSAGVGEAEEFQVHEVKVRPVGRYAVEHPERPAARVKKVG